MKKLLLICLVVFTVKTSQAQSWVYHAFPTDSAAWMQHHVSDAMSDRNYRTYMLGDTVINGLNYKKIYQTITIWIDGPVPIEESDYYGAMREDIAIRKIYLFGRNDATEKVLYDFDIQLSDTIAIDSFTMGNPDAIYVSAIDSVLVDQNYNKRFVLTSTSGFPVGGLIEGVGSEAGLGNLYTFSGTRADDLICLSIRNHNVYAANGASLPAGHCAYALGIGDFKNNRIEIEFGPNPSHGILNLTISCKDSYSLEVINSGGEIILKREGLSLSNTSVDLNSFANGIYLIRVSDSKGNTVTKKVVKE